MRLRLLKPLLSCALLALGLGATASAASITNITVLGLFHTPTNDGFGNPAFAPVVTPAGASTSTTVTWGEPPPPGLPIKPQSSYVFTRNNPADQTVNPPPITPFFKLGDFTHNNFVVDSPVLTSVMLDVILSFNVDGVPTGPLTFTYLLEHTETNNTIETGPPSPLCPFLTPIGEGCTDRVLISGGSPTNFNVGGVNFQLELSFNGGVSQFLTREQLSNNAEIFGRFAASDIPEPQTYLTVGTALIGLVVALRRRKPTKG